MTTIRWRLQWKRDDWNLHMVQDSIIKALCEKSNADWPSPGRPKVLLVTFLCWGPSCETPSLKDFGDDPLRPRRPRPCYVGFHPRRVRQLFTMLQTVRKVEIRGQHYPPGVHIPTDARNSLRRRVPSWVSLPSRIPSWVDFEGWLTVVGPDAKRPHAPSLEEFIDEIEWVGKPSFG